MEINFNLPIPHSSLSPNSRKHWRVKHPHKVAARDAAEIAAREFIQSWEKEHNAKWVPLDGAREQTMFVFKDKRKRDKDNFGAMLKHTWDGMTRAGLWVDDCGLTHLPLLMSSETNKPRVEITIYTDDSAPEGASHKPVEEGDL